MTPSGAQTVIHPQLSSQEIHMFSFFRRLPLAQIRMYSASVTVVLLSFAILEGSNWN
jgi:hypothetical protein